MRLELREAWENRERYLWGENNGWLGQTNDWMTTAFVLAVIVAAGALALIWHWMGVGNHPGDRHAFVWARFDAIVLALIPLLVSWLIIYVGGIVAMHKDYKHSIRKEARRR